MRGWEGTHTRALPCRAMRSSGQGRTKRGGGGEELQGGCAVAWAPAVADAAHRHPGHCSTHVQAEDQADGRRQRAGQARPPPRHCHGRQQACHGAAAAMQQGRGGCSRMVPATAAMPAVDTCDLSKSKSSRMTGSSGAAANVAAGAGGRGGVSGRARRQRRGRAPFARARAAAATPMRRSPNTAVKCASVARLQGGAAGPYHYRSMVKHRRHACPGTPCPAPLSRLTGAPLTRSCACGGACH